MLRRVQGSSLPDLAVGPPAGTEFNEESRLAGRSKSQRRERLAGPEPFRTAAELTLEVVAKDEERRQCGLASMDGRGKLWCGAGLVEVVQLVDGRLVEPCRPDRVQCPVGGRDNDDLPLSRALMATARSGREPVDVGPLRSAGPGRVEEGAKAERAEGMEGTRGWGCRHWQ